VAGCDGESIAQIGYNPRRKNHPQIARIARILSMPTSIFAHLSTPTADQGGALAGVLARLGDYAEQVVRPLNMRPTGAALVLAEGERVEVRVSTPGRHVLVVIAPEAELAGEVCFLRAMAERNLPAPRIISHDLSCAPLPFCYAITGYIGAPPLDPFADEMLLRVVGRQVGRVLRRLHQAPAAGFGRPQASGRWPTRTWRAALGVWLARRQTRPRAHALLGTERAAALWAATIDHTELEWAEPRALHGGLAPTSALVAPGEGSLSLEALVRPGEIIGGDPLFDLAHGLLPRHPEAWRRGLLEGYAAAGPLPPEQIRRLRRLQLLLFAADALGRAEPTELARLPAILDAELEQIRELR
jgi:aminoglycoside phosphotransferase (APT) family kinase protein